jgi:hypothetical protein
MISRSTGKLALGILIAFGTLTIAAPVQAGDFFSMLFGGLRPQPAPMVRMPFAPEEDQVTVPGERPARIGYGGGQAYCVRGCDGRYFPIAGTDKESKAASCNSFCPASQTELVYGNTIDHAATENGKPYSELPNAFRYRNEIVAGCTCNGKDQFGLAPVSIENDPTLRKGDLVAGADGLTAAPDKRTAQNYTPLPRSVRSHYRQVPVVAAE